VASCGPTALIHDRRGVVPFGIGELIRFGAAIRHDPKGAAAGK
jgi:hypothetical protein